MLTTPRSQQKHRESKLTTQQGLFNFGIPAVKNMAYQTVKSHHSEVE